MANPIGWTERTWNPVSGCTKVSEACQHCYAERMSKRLAGRCGYPADDPFRVTVHWDKMDAPRKWRKPQRIFPCSMSDLFHEDIDSRAVAAVIKTIVETPWHTYQILTKRPQEIQPFLYWWQPYYPERRRFPANVWLGVTAENQRRADERIPTLLRVPVAVRFVSVEPLLGETDLSKYLSCEFYAGPMIEPRVGTIGGKAMPAARLRPRLDWVIIGPETGPGARPCKDKWVESLIDQCRAASVPVWVKGRLFERFPIHELQDCRGAATNGGV